MEIESSGLGEKMHFVQRVGDHISTSQTSAEFRHSVLFCVE